MAELTLQDVSKTSSLTPTFAAAANGGDTFANNGAVLLYIRNADGVASRTVTIDSLVNCNQGFDHNPEVTIPASGEKMVGFFPGSRFNSAAGQVTLTYDDETDITIAAIRISRD